MREAPNESRWNFPPERVMPAELTAAQDVVLLEIIEVALDGRDGIDRCWRIARDVVGHGDADAKCLAARSDVGHAHRSIGMRGVSVAVGWPPTHRAGGILKGFVSRGGRIVSRGV